MAKDYRLKGHESFIIREGWLTKGLSSVKNDPKLFRASSGADALGVGTNMAKSIRYWLKTAGLTIEHPVNGVKLSELGNVLYENDLYLEDVFSLWIIHTNIVRNFSQATSWNVFFNDIDVSVFERDELFAMMYDIISELTGDTKISERSLKDDCAAIIGMYLNDKEEIKDPEDKKESPFKVLGLLEGEGRFYEKYRPDISTIDPMIIMYYIALELEQSEQNSDVRSILIDDIIESRNMPGRIMHMNRMMINDCLDSLQNLGYITVNRTAGLDIVYENRIVTPEQVVKEYFERKH